MTSRNSTTRILLTLAVLAAACGTGDTSTTESETSTTTGTTTETTVEPTSTTGNPPGTTTTTVDPTTPGTTTETVDPTTSGTTTETIDTTTEPPETSTTDTGESTTTTGSTTEGETESSTTEGCVSEDRAIKLGKLVNPKDGSVLEDAIVVVHGDRISQVTTDENEIPCGAEVIDWSGFTGLPGLVDAHTHFAYQTDQEPGTTAWERRNWLHQNAPLVLVAEARKAALATIKKGVTSAIDKGAGNLEYAVVTVRNEIDAGTIPGPRIFHAWKGIWWYNGITLGWIKSWIDQQALHGADLLKIWADGCSDKVLECVPLFTQEELTAAVDHAHSLGKKIAIHAYHADTAKLAILAGADSIEHPEGLEESDFFDMVDKGVVYVPTIAHNEYYAQNLELFGYGPDLVPQLDAFTALNVATVGAAHAAGVKIAMGSDAVFTGFGQNTRELHWLVQAGLTPLEALRSATIVGAESIGHEDEIGSVEPGYYADIIAVEGDPLADIDVVIDGVVAVMKGGELVEF